MGAVLVDTNVFVAHLRGTARFRPGKHVVSFSSVTRAELFAGAPAAEDRIRMLLAPFREIPVDREIAERAGRLRSLYALAFVDALIGATALQHRLTLVTRSPHHFGGVRALRSRTPVEERVVAKRASAERASAERAVDDGAFEA